MQNYIVESGLISRGAGLQLSIKDMQTQKSNESDENYYRKYTVWYKLQPY